MAEAEAIAKNGVRRARIRHAMTQTDLASKVGISQAMIHFWEKEKATPSPEQKGHLKKFLGVFGRRLMRKALTTRTRPSRARLAAG